MLEASRRLKECEFISYDEALDNFYGNWIWRAIHALLDHQDFDSSPIWISKRLDISIEEVVEAFEGLKVLGLVTQDESGFKAKQVQFIVPEKFTTLESMVRKHRDVSQQILNQVSVEKNLKGRLYFVASNSEELERLDRKINEALLEFNKRSESCKKDGLYAVTATAIDLLNNKGEK